MTEQQPIKIGSIITNGSSALRVDRRVNNNPRWRTPGWEGVVIAMEEFASRGVRDFVPDYLASSWRHVPFEWASVVGSHDLEVRYVWSHGYRYLQREVRRCQP
jgi:hypothetical protein